MQKITTFLWFDGAAQEAVNFYASLFSNSKIGRIARYDEASAAVSGMPLGSVMTASVTIGGQEIVGLNGGPEFKFSPATSFFVSCSSQEEINGIYEKLSQGGSILMELGKYPFSEKYCWLNDRFGVSWQLNLAPRKQKITPCLLFVGSQHGKAEEAMNFYVSLFKDSKVVSLERYKEGEGDVEGTVKHATFSLNGQEFIAMESGLGHKFSFSPATSFAVYCDSQEEIDFLWEKLLEGGKPYPCGWLSDRFCVTWQIVPVVLIEMLQDKDAEKAKRVMKAMLEMVKLDIAVLKKAYAGQ